MSTSTAAVREKINKLEVQISTVEDAYQSVFKQHQQLSNDIADGDFSRLEDLPDIESAKSKFESQLTALESARDRLNEEFRRAAAEEERIVNAEKWKSIDRELENRTKKHAELQAAIKKAGNLFKQIREQDQALMQSLREVLSTEKRQKAVDLLGNKNPVISALWLSFPGMIDLGGTMMLTSDLQREGFVIQPMAARAAEQIMDLGNA